MVFVMFGAFALAGAIVLFLLGHETGGQVLETVSPPVSGPAMENR
jgi:hypothetical protein